MSRQFTCTFFVVVVVVKKPMNTFLTKLFFLSGGVHQVRHQEERDGRGLRPEVGGKLSGIVPLGRSPPSR